MAEVNGMDHLVRHEKETKLNGYDNEGFHSQERSEEDDESASDEDRLREVVTENGHRPEDDSPLSNGHLREESNGYSNAVNGSAVIVVEDGKGDYSSMNDNKQEGSQKPLDTRLHHYVPVDDIDRRILNGSDGTHVTIPEDAVISFTTGRVKVKKGASNSQPGTNDRESIPLETILPSYDAEDKIGLGGGEKAELEAELANHKNGLWSEGHNAYSNPEVPFGNSEKINGTSKSSDEVSLPVNNHRKCLSSDVSDTSSEQKSTFDFKKSDCRGQRKDHMYYFKDCMYCEGEKLYFTDETRKFCPGWRRMFLCGLIVIIISVALLLGVLAATGILLAESDSKNSRYESGHSSAPPSLDSISHAGHSIRPRPPSSQVPQNFLPPVNSTGDTVSRSPVVVPLPTVTSKVPVRDDPSHSQTIVPNALVGEFTIDENFTDDLKDNTSEGYQSLAKYIERELNGIFRRNGGKFEELKILSFSPGSIKIKFVTIWSSDRNIILSHRAVEIMKSYLRKHRNSLLAYPVDLNSIHFKDVFDECKFQKGGCSYKCIWDYDTLSKQCICQENLVLLEDGMSCGPQPSTSKLETTTPKLTYQTPGIITTVTEPTSVRDYPSKSTEILNKEIVTTDKIPTLLSKAITAITDIYKELVTTESTTSVNEIASLMPNLTISEFTSTDEGNLTQPATEVPVKMSGNISSSESPDVINETSTNVPTIIDSPLIFRNFSSENNATENVTFSTNLPLDTTDLNLSLETSTEQPTTNISFWIESNTKSDTVISDENKKENDTMLTTPLDIESNITESDNNTIGYHIVEEATEMYTFSDIESEFNATDMTTQEIRNTTDDASTTITSNATFLEPANDKSTLPEYNYTEVLTTEIPPTSVGSSMSEGVEFNATELPSIISPDTTITTDYSTMDEELLTTMKTVGEEFTDAEDETEVMLAEEISNTYNDTTNATDVSFNDTTDIETTTANFLTTMIDIPVVFPQSNRTPEVRSFDEDVQNDTYVTTIDSLTKVEVTNETVTEIYTHDNSTSTIELNPLTSSPVTTTLPTVELFSEITLLVNTSEEPTSPETTIRTVIENGRENDTSSILEIAETTLASTDIPMEKSETEIYTELSGLTPEKSNTLDVINNGTFEVGILNNDSQITTIEPMGTELYNETHELSNATETSFGTNYNLGNSEIPETSASSTEFPGIFISENNTVNNTTHADVNATFESVDMVSEVIAAENVTTTVLNDAEITATSAYSNEPSETITSENITINTPAGAESNVTLFSHDEEPQIISAENITTTVSSISDINVTLASDMEITQTFSSNFTEKTEDVSNVEDIAVSSYNETTTVENFETTISHIENVNNTGIIDNSSDIEDANAEINTTENHFIFTTLNPMNISDDETTLESDTITAILEDDVLYRQNINNSEEMTGNSTLTDTSNSTNLTSSEGMSTITDSSNSTNFSNSEETSTFKDSLNFTNSSDESSTLTDYSNSTDFNKSEETYTVTTVDDFSFPTPPTHVNGSEEDSATEPNYDAKMLTTVEYNNTFNDDLEIDSNSTQTFNVTGEDSFNGTFASLLPEMNDPIENSTFMDAFGNFTTDGYEDVTNESTTNASTGIECREDQFLCEALNKCINNTFMCDGIADCPDSRDEFECKDSCQSNFMCANSSICIMHEARCDGIWDCENGTDEENCTPVECAKHEVMCLDGSKCIKPGHICDLQYNCLDRSDEVGCVERTTCESGGRFFCNDGLCIPWSLKCDGEHDCKDGEDEGNCTCLHDEFQCNDGKCLKSSSRCDGHQDCHDADDEMGCVNVDSEHIVSTYEPYSGTWGLLCAEDWNLDDGQHLCQELGFGHVLNVERIHVSFNGTWMAMRRDNLTDASLWTERVSFVESCTSGQAAAVECQKFVCGEYTGLLHRRRRRRDVISSSSSQWPFIGYTSTFHSNKGCLSEILTPIWLITSAECLLSISKQPFNGSDWYVRTNIGRHTEMDVAQNHEVLKIITHPHSSKFRSLTLRDYDVAMIRLKHALVFVSDKIGAICPPEEQVPPGITCFSGVLGTEKPRAPPPQELTINSLALQLIDRKNCNSVEHFNNTINHRMLCTQSSEGHSICDNDEGTPLMCLTGINKWFLAGMLTYQRFCDVYNKHPAVFSNLFSMRKFLDQVTGQKQYEIPYDNNVYSIIPPTTPSPTLPETTTFVISLETTTELDTLSLSTIDFENATGYDAYGEFNGTTVAYEELAREENDTATISEQVTPALTNVTEETVHYNETVTPPNGTEFDAINATSQAAEVPSEEIPSNKTHSSFTSLLNDTSSENINVTDIFTIDDIDTENETLPDMEETTTVLQDLTNVTTDVELDNTSNVTEDINNVTNTGFTDMYMNETGELQTDMVTVDNVTDTIDDSSADSELYNLNLTFSNLSRIAATDIPLVTSFNESLGMFEPVMTLANENISISQPLISLINDTSELDTEGLTTLEPSENSTENILLTSLFNETIEVIQPIIALTDENTSISQPLISLINDTTEEGKESLTTSEPSIYTIENTTLTSTLNDSIIQFKSMMKLTNESMFTDLPLTSVTKATTAIDEGNTTTSETFNNNTDDMPWIGIFEESLEMMTPLRDSTNKSASIIQPLISPTNNTAEMKKASYRTLPILEFPLNNTEDISSESILFENNTNFFNDTMEKVTPTEVAMSTEAAELELSNSPISDKTDTFSFEIEGEPDADLAFSIFRKSDGLKFESYSEKINETNNTAEELIRMETPADSNTTSITIQEDSNISATETQEESNITTIEPEEGRNMTAIEDFIDVNITTTETQDKNMTEIEIQTETNVTENPELLELKSKEVNMTLAEIQKDTSMTTIESPTDTIMETTDAYDNTTRIIEDQESEIMTTMGIEDNTETTTREVDRNVMITTEKLQEDANITEMESLEHSNETAYSTSVDGLTLLLTTTPVYPKYALNEEEINVSEFDNSTTELEVQSGSKTLPNYTTPAISEITSAATNTSDENYENITTTPKLESDMDKIEDLSVKMHLMSEGLTVLPDNMTQCGNWDYSFETARSNISDDFFLKWPALGYLQMASEPKICPSAVVSTRFVITSLNCLTLRDTNLDPNKWTYIGGSKATSSRLQKYKVKEIIPYPNPGDSAFLNEHDVALVKVRDSIKMDNYSKTVCLAEDTSLNKECFVAGWSRNGSGDQQRQFHSIPLTMISTKECNNTRNYDGMLMDYLICGVNNTSLHACELEFGSPLFCPNENQRWEIHGVLNFPSPCDTVQPLVFSSIVDLKKWTADTLKINKMLIN